MQRFVYIDNLDQWVVLQFGHKCQCRLTRQTAHHGQSNKLCQHVTSQHADTPQDAAPNVTTFQLSQPTVPKNRVHGVVGVRMFSAVRFFAMSALPHAPGRAVQEYYL